MKQITDKLHEELMLQDPGLVGCQRRAQWIDGDPPWRWVRGNALLQLVGDKHTVYTFGGPMDVFLRSDTFLLQYRGGPWNTYWVEDFYDTYALARHDRELANTILILHEDKGRLDIKQLPAPKDWPERLGRMEQDFMKDPRGRISKATSYALKACKWCPVKTKCDAHDKLKGEDHDWSPHYPTP